MAKARKRSSKKPARAKKAARRAPARRKTAPKKAPAKAAAPSLEGLARKIVRMSQAPSFGPAEIRELYNPDAVSVEASGATAQGYAALDQKMKGWEQMTASMSSKPRNVWTGRNTICIEWDSTVTFRDGRTAQLREVAVHEIKNGKIQSERYYYDPSALAPPAAAGGTPVTTAGAPMPSGA
jgi:ketosteroid isomerase-like protein